MSLFSDGTLLPVIIDGFNRRKDGTYSIKLETQELNPGQVAGVAQLAGKIAYVYVSEKQVLNVSDKRIIDNLDPELKGKTPGQRLRAVLFVWWQQNKSSDPTLPQDFERFYEAKMGQFIEGVKQELV